MKATHYRELIVWQRSIEFVKAIYKVSGGFPRDEAFGLVSQIRRAAVSVPSNVAEGQARRTTGEFPQFLGHAQGSLAEVDTQLVLAVELRLVPSDSVREAAALVDECQRMLRAMQTKLIESS